MNLLLTTKGKRRAIGGVLLLTVTSSLGAEPAPSGPFPDWQDRLVLSYRKTRSQRQGTEELHHKILRENPGQQESIRRLADLYEGKKEYFLAQVINRYLLQRNLRDRKLLMQQERLARKLAEQPEKKVAGLTVEVVREFTDRALAQQETPALETMEVDLRARMAAGERHPEWLFALARLSEARQRWKFGTILLEFCLKEAPDNSRYVERQTELLSRIGETDRAVEILEAYFSGVEADPRLLPLACRTALAAGAYAAAQSYAEAWVDHQPENYKAWLGLGEAQVKLEEMDLARKALLKSVGLEKENKEAYYFLTLIALHDQDGESARNWFSRYRQLASATEVAETLQWPPFADWLSGAKE